jgi:radical SAM-linked protein
VTRIRVRFVKLGKIRWTSHRDVARMWERAFRRVQLPVAYSAGFAPRPKVSFGLALPTGYESVAEYLDVELVADADLDVRTLPRRLSTGLPVGIDATAAELIAPGTPSLQEDVTTCTWRWAATPKEHLHPPGEEDLAARAAALLAAPSVVVTRIRKGEELTDDIRAGVRTLQLLGPVGPDPSHGTWVEAELACRPRTLRPSEVMVALHPDCEERNVRRMHQWILRDGARREPLEAVEPPGATDAPHAWGRAS